MTEANATLPTAKISTNPHKSSLPELVDDGGVNAAQTLTIKEVKNQKLSVTAYR